jgi:hypothetical protein
MTKIIEIADETAEIVARQSVASGMTEAQIVDEWARAADAELEEIRAAIRIGAEQADRGKFSSQTVTEIVDEAIAEFEREQAVR